MEHPGFFRRVGPFTLSEVAERCEGVLAEGTDGSLSVGDVKPLDLAGPGDISFLDNRKYLDQLSSTKASACFIKKAFTDRLPDGVSAIVCDDPYRSFARSLMLFYPESGQPLGTGLAAGEAIAADAEIEDNVTIEAGAVVGAGAMIGAGTTVCANAVIGCRVAVGRNCYIGPNVSLQHALVGNGVILQAGVRIGTDGFGFAMGPHGHLKVPQIGRAIIQDHVEIGANTTIDRGALKDTIIGEGTKIDNLVQIGHNVVTGRHCVLVSQVAIAGSTSIGDFVVMGGQVAVAGHLTIASGVMIAATSNVKDSLKSPGRYGGTPARPFREWARELAELAKLGKGRSGKPKA